MKALTDNGAVRRKAIYDPEQCNRIVNLLWEVREKWFYRADGFYTLGAAAYMDACGSNVNTDRYMAICNKSNFILRNYFEDVLERVRVTLEETTRESCNYTNHFALPGFHIFLAKSLHQNFRDNLHLDLQYSCLTSKQMCSGRQ